MNRKNYLLRITYLSALPILIFYIIQLLLDVNFIIGFYGLLLSIPFAIILIIYLFFINTQRMLSVGISPYWQIINITIIGIIIIIIINLIKSEKEINKNRYKSITLKIITAKILIISAVSLITYQGIIYYYSNII